MLTPGYLFRSGNDSKKIIPSDDCAVISAAPPSPDLQGAGGQPSRWAALAMAGVSDIAADPLILVLLHHAQPLRLQRQRQFAYLVQEQDAAIGHRGRAVARIGRRRQGTALLAGQPALKACVHGNEGRITD
jgi:hypothetical protein